MTSSVSVVALVVAAGCAATEDTGELCARASELVQECTGAAPAECLEGDGAASEYERIINAIEEDGCEALAGGKGDGWVCDLLSIFGWCDEAPEPLFPEPVGSATRFPIILAHGFNTSTTNFWRFNDVDVALKGDGHVVGLGSVAPFDTPQVRGAQLETQLDAIIANTGAKKVNLICFSMGGLDCRYLASPGGLDRGDQIASITMISSPNRGSGIADATLGFLPDADNAKLVDALASLWGMTFSEVGADSHLVAALEAMSERHIGELNASTPDAPGVIYQSWAGFSHVFGQTLGSIERSIEDACVDASGTSRIFRNDTTRDSMDPLLVASAAFVGHFNPLRPGDALPNDGVSTIESAKWGRFRGCFPADHLDQVGQIKDDGLDPDTGFDYRRFYRHIAFDLAAQGF